MFENKLDLLLKKNSITNIKLSEELESKFGYKISKESIAKYRKGERTPSPDFIDFVLKLTNSDASSLFGENKSSVKSVPVISTASCGSAEINCLQDEKMKTFINEDEWNKDLYAVVACGDSMATEIYDGDIAIIDPFVKVQNGDMVYYKIDDESAIKVFFEDEENYLINFIPFNTNENFKIRTIRKDDKETNDRLVYHKVVHVVSSKKNNRATRLKMIGR